MPIQTKILFQSLSLILSLISLAESRQASDSIWSYWGKRGENSWEKEFDKCRGRMQSPIDINTKRLVYEPNMKVDFINYDVTVNYAKMYNTGYKVKISAEQNSTDILLSGSAVNNQTYRFIELHFHWNDGPNNGSEHAIDGKKFVMEAHIMHRNVKYNDTETANIHDDGYAIIALVYVEEDQPNLMYDMIIDHLHNVQDIGQEYTFETPIYLESLLPPNKEVFYRYFGSYTTPRCNEAVTWIIYPEPVFIDRKQMNKFRTLYTTTFDIRTGHLKRLVGNIRHLQDIGNRIVYTSNTISRFQTNNKIFFIYLISFEIIMFLLI